MRTDKLKRYSKWMALGLVLALAVILLVKTDGTRGAAGVFIPAGFDQFTTPSDGNTYHNFSDHAVAQGFFDTPGSGGTSDPYSGNVPLKGVPIPGQGGADTVIQRDQAVTTPGTTTLTVVGLSLASINPIIVTFSDSHQETWNMAVGLSQIQASTGSMTITDDSATSGKFDSTLTIIPRFTFTRVSDGTQKIWDTGGGGRTSSANSLQASREQALAQSSATIAPCPIIIDTPTETATVNRSQGAVKSKEQTAPSINRDADLTGRGVPIVLNSTGTGWNLVNGAWRPKPPTELDLLRKHMPKPKCR